VWRDEGDGKPRERAGGQMRSERVRERERERERERVMARENKTDRRQRVKGREGEVGLAHRTFHGRRERPSGVALCHIQPPTSVGSPSFK